MSKILDERYFSAPATKLAPDLIVVVAYGKILPKSVLDYPKHGCINVHGSLLPAYRGAAPMQRAIIDGCAETGITTIFMADGIDTGDMLLKAETRIGELETAGELTVRLSEIGAQLLIDTLKRYPEDKMVIITTGSQGEPMSALSRMASGNHRKVSIDSNDCVIISAKPIPGNEKTVFRVINDLLKLGARVIYEKMYDVHVSGHACQEEQKLLLSITFS